MLICCPTFDFNRASYSGTDFWGIIWVNWFFGVSWVGFSGFRDSSLPPSWLSKVAAPGVNSKQSTCPLILFLNKEKCREKKKSLHSAFCVSPSPCFKVAERPHVCPGFYIFWQDKRKNGFCEGCHLVFSDFVTGTLKSRLWCQSRVRLMKSEVNGRQQ